jgi:DNA repair protein RecO (recombination protein O)
MLLSDRAICIRAVDYSETSQVVTFFAEKVGKLTAIAKGSKRPKSSFGGPIEILSCGRIGFTETHGDKLATITDFEQTVAHTNLVADLYRYNCCLFAAELVNLLTDDYDPHPGLHKSLLNVLASINDAPKDSPPGDILASLVKFQFCLLQEVGLAPVFDACINCKHRFGADWPRAWFSNASSGLICRDCEMSFPDKTPISKTAVLALGKPGAADGMPLKALRDLERLLISYITYQLHREPKMARYALP